MIDHAAMTPYRHLIRFLVSLGTVLLVSCIEGREEIWLSANGTGRADVSYSLPAVAATLHGGEDGIRQLIRGLLEGNPAISSSKLEVSTIDDRLHIRVQASFESLLELKKLAQSASQGDLPSSARFMAGEVNVKIEGLTVDFSRTIAPGKALPGATFIPKSQTNHRTLTYIIHLPEAATESNATLINDKGRTLIWEFPLAQAIQKPVITRFKAPIPIPFWVPAAILTTLSVLVALIIFKLRKPGIPRPPLAAA